MEYSKDSAKVLGALLIGAAVGAALGILFAPDKGSKTRSKLLGGAQDLAEDLKQQMLDEAEVFSGRATELQEMAEGKVKTIANDAKRNLEAFTNHK